MLCENFKEKKQKSICDDLPKNYYVAKKNQFGPLGVHE